MKKLTKEAFKIASSFFPYIGMDTTLEDQAKRLYDLVRLKSPVPVLIYDLSILVRDFLSEIDGTRWRKSLVEELQTIIEDFGLPDQEEAW